MSLSVQGIWTCKTKNNLVKYNTITIKNIPYIQFAVQNNFKVIGKIIISICFNKKTTYKKFGNSQN